MKALQRLFANYGWLLGCCMLVQKAWIRSADEVRMAVFRQALGACGRGSRIGSSVIITAHRRIFLGDDCLIADRCELFCETHNGEIRCGDRVNLNYGAHVDYSGVVELEDDVLISQDAIIYTHSHGYDPRSEPVVNELVVGRGAWIGARAIIMPGVRRIGAYAVVGAAAVVTKDVPVGAIVAGQPARVLKLRPEAQT